MNRKKFIKSYIASVLAGIIFIISAISMSPLTVNASLRELATNGNNAREEYTLTYGNSFSWRFMHAHQTPTGTFISQNRQANQTIYGYSTPSPCYIKKVADHVHEGNTTSGGACYDPVYHQHTSACHTIVYHKHTDSCKNYTNRYVIMSIPSPYPLYVKKQVLSSFTCPKCNKTTTNIARLEATYSGCTYIMYLPNYPGTISPLAIGANTDYKLQMSMKDMKNNVFIGESQYSSCCGKRSPSTQEAPYSTETYWDGTYKCYKTPGVSIDSDTITCGKTAGSTIDRYKLKTTDPYYTGELYEQTCNEREVGSFAETWNHNTLFTSVRGTSLSSIYGNAYSNITVTITDPSGNITNLNTNNSNDEYHCTDIGEHTCVVHFEHYKENYPAGSGTYTKTDEDTLTLKFTPVPVDTTVKFYNGSTLLDTKTFQKGTEDNIVSIPTKTGYRFEGYYTDLNDENTLVYSSTGVKVMEKFCPLNGGTVNLYAKFVPETFTVSYFIENSIEETVNNAQKDFTYDQTTGLNITAQKEYDGWQTDGFYYGDAKLFNNDGSFVRDKWDIAENIDVAPHYTPNTYTLYYNNNKEDSVTANSLEINYNDNYCLPATAISGRTEYEGYAFNGWYDGDTLIFDAEGNNTDSGKWRYLSDISATATYTANPYTVNYNTNETDAPSKTLDVTYDSAYSIPSEDVALVPSIPGYTFDGWFDSNNNKIFNKNGTSVADVYKFDHNITVYATYHKNNYIVHYNTSQIPDEYLDRTQTVTFDMEYLNIDEAPYKPGYVFMGHKLEGTMSFIWDGYGSKTHAIWDFLCGEDGSEVNAVKVYEPKTFTIKIGDDADNNNAIDSVEDTQNATFDSTFFGLSIPSARNGYTFDGYYCPELDAWVARYNSNNNTLTKTSNTWIWDDNIDWNDSAHSDLTLIKKWHANKYFVCYNDTTELNPTFTNSIVRFLNAGADINHILMLYNRNGEENLVVLSENGSAYASMVCLDENNKPAGVAVVGDPSTYYYFSTQLWGGDWWNNQNFYIYLDEQAPYPNTFFYPLICYNAAYLPLTTHLGEIRTAGNTHIDYGVNGMQIDIPEDKILQYNIAIYNQAYPYIGTQPHKYGYTSLGYYFKDANNEEQQIYNTNGEKTRDVLDFNLGKDNSGISVYKKYEPNDYTVYYNTNENNNPTLELDVTFDENYAIPSDKVVSVPDKEGYTFDGWFLADGTKIFDTDGTPTGESTYDFEGDRTVYVRYHSNDYTVHYNSTSVSDSTLPNSISVKYDAAYENIERPPYKEGYTFEGYTTSLDNGTFLWDRNANAVNSTWQYNAGTDTSELSVYKIYEPKEFTVNIGLDYNEDGVIDTENLPSGYNYSATDTVTFDAPFTLSLDNINEPGLTLDGYYIAGTNTLIADYDEVNDTLTYLSNTWIWDDGLNWNTESYTGTFDVVARFVHDDIDADIYTETSDKETSTTVGESDNYTFTVDSEVFSYDAAYDDITVPQKRGYTFNGYIVDPKNNDEAEHIWNENGESLENTFLWLPTVNNTKVTIKSVFTPNTITGTINANEYDYETDTETEHNIEISETYDSAYEDLPFIPEKEGYIFSGIEDENGNLIWDKDGEAVMEVWQYIEEDIASFNILWTPKTYVLKYDKNKTETITFNESVNNIDAMSKDGYTFSGYSFNYLGTDTAIFNADGEFTSNVWLYDVGPTGTEIDLKDHFDANTYKITFTNTDDEIEVIYDLAYNKCEVPSKDGYTFKGYKLTTSDDYIYDENGDCVNETYTYSKDIEVEPVWEALTYALTFGDKTFNVVFDGKVDIKAPIPTKETTSDDIYTYSYKFDGWYLSDERIFDEVGEFIGDTWTIVLDKDSITLTPQFKETKTEIPKQETPKETPQETPAAGVSNITETVFTPIVEEPKQITPKEKKEDLAKKIAETTAEVITSITVTSSDDNDLTASIKETQQEKIEDTVLDLTNASLNLIFPDEYLGKEDTSWGTMLWKNPAVKTLTITGAVAVPCVGTLYLVLLNFFHINLWLLFFGKRRKEKKKAEENNNQ